MTVLTVFALFLGIVVVISNHSIGFARSQATFGAVVAISVIEVDVVVAALTVLSSFLSILFT